MASSESELKAQLDQLLAEYKHKLASVATEQEVRKVFADYGGSQGAIRLAQKSALQSAPNAEKKAIGLLTNVVVREAESIFERWLAEQANRARDQELHRSVDVTLPGRAQPLGHLHPSTLARREIEQIFAEIGFTVAEGPQIETDFNNFEALAMPPDHPARDMQDTFYVAGADDLVLRTHTSPVQIREMLRRPPPVRIIAPGWVYRKDDDPTHSPMFSQVEGLCVDEGVTFGDLKGTLLHFAKKFFGEDFGVRLRPSFFPFTEPSAEIDFTCAFCASLGTRADGGGRGCRTCKGSGWIEIGGAGMVDPEVFRNVGYDSEKYTGFAFGWGIDRMAMLKYKINDIKLFFEGDVRFARQFR
jgi:phenylalanyl-tRNA synthetase alpha chain